MKNNVIKIHFKNANTMEGTPVSQWDTGQVIEFVDNFPTGAQVQFKQGNTTINRIIMNKAVQIPNEILTRDDTIVAWIQVINRDNSTTVKTLMIPVRKRLKPADYVTPEDEPTFIEQVQQMIDEIRQTADSVRQDADNGEFDGISPSITIQSVEGGHKVVIQDAEGTKEFIVMDGNPVDVEGIVTSHIQEYNQNLQQQVSKLLDELNAQIEDLDNSKMERYVIRLVKNSDGTYKMTALTGETLSFNDVREVTRRLNEYVVVLYGNSKLRPQYVSDNEMMFIGLDRSTESKILRILYTPTRMAYETFKLTEWSDFNEAVTRTSQQILEKQDKLVSGTNIKTINNQSILGDGNIEIQGGGTPYDDTELREKIEELSPLVINVVGDLVGFEYPIVDTSYDDVIEALRINKQVKIFAFEVSIAIVLPSGIEKVEHSDLLYMKTSNTYEYFDIVTVGVDEEGKPAFEEDIHHYVNVLILLGDKPILNDVQDLEGNSLVNEEGVYVVEPSQSVDVQINGASIVQDGVAKIPFGSSTVYGVFRYNTGYGIGGSNGTLQISRATDTEIENRSGSYKPIVPSTLDKAIKQAMCDGKGAEWSSTEKKSAQERIGIIDRLEKIVDVTTTEDGLTKFKCDFPKPVKHMRILVTFPENVSNSPYTYFRTKDGETQLSDAITGVTSNNRWVTGMYHIFGGFVFGYWKAVPRDYMSTTFSFLNMFIPLEEFNDLTIYTMVTGHEWPSGTRIEVWGS